ncbi:unnamed protein product [Owenia fusiformis]|uniref:Carboxylic ester hydrolase n=1 Tax=Owenia fusiformis TaxID=6347 RepID=A0A8S4PJ97_OWEFU|nr:unnamed protein product [Owenia fusiformis]
MVITGFLTLQSDTARGNYGLFDQLEALKFVNRNIKNFGGDPSRVTIGGESAGAVSSAVHLISPMSYPKGLFSQIILQSGSDVVPWGITEAAIVVPRNYALQLADLLDCPDVTSDDAILECLRDPDDDYIMSLAGLIGVESKPGMLTLSWAPSDDGPGGIIPEHPRIVRKRGEVPTIPALIGITSHEAAWFADFIEGVSEGVNRTVFKDLVTQMIEGFLNIDENDKPALIDAVVFKYTDWTDEENPLLYRDAITQAFTDVSFGNGMDQWARYNTLKSDTYQYVFAYRSEMNILPDWYGVPHALDVPYTFGYPHVVTNQAFAKETGIAAIFNWTDADRAASDEMTKLWANFVKTGNPTPDTNTWKPFKMNDYKYLNIAKPANKLEKDFRIREYAFWREYVPKLVKVENDIPSQTTPKKMPRTTSNPLRTGSSITESPKMSSSSPMRSTQTLQTLKPTTDGTATGNEDKQTNEKLKMTDRWRIATIVVSCVAGLLLLVTLGLIFMKCSTKNKSEENKSLDFELSRNDSANYYDNVASKY